MVNDALQIIRVPCEERGQDAQQARASQFRRYVKKGRALKYNLESAYGLKSLVEDLFGKKAWVEVKHATDVKTWKKYSLKIISAIELAAKSTVEISDNEWFQELNSIVEHGKGRINRSKSTEEIFASLSASVASISFFQLGRLPNNSCRQQVTLRHKGNWKFNEFRSVQYVQNKEQAYVKKQYNKSRASYNKEIKQDG